MYPDELIKEQLKPAETKTLLADFGKEEVIVRSYSKAVASAGFSSPKNNIVSPRASFNRSIGYSPSPRTVSGYSYPSNSVSSRSLSPSGYRSPSPSQLSSPSISASSRSISPSISPSGFSSVSPSPSQSKYKSPSISISPSISPSSSTSIYGSPEPTKTKIIIPGISGSSQLGSFSVDVRRFGKFQTVGQGLSLPDAVKLVKRVVGNSAAATFRVRKGGEVVRVDPISGFYMKEKNVIENPGRRIKSYGELKEITFEGIKASKNKSRRGLL